MQIRSILNKIAENVFTEKDFLKAQKLCLDLLKEHEVKDKQKMIKDVESVKSLIALQKYIANSLLKYEGLGLNQINKVKEDD